MFKKKFSFCFTVFLLTLIFTCPVFAQKQDKSTDKSIDAVSIKKQIDSISKEIVASDSKIITKPDISRDKSVNKRLNYNFGKVNILLFELASDDPYFLVYKIQIQVEALRKINNKSISKEICWQQTLNKADALVLEIITQIESTGDKDELETKLDQFEDQYQEILIELEEFIVNYAKKKGLEAVKVGGRIPASSSYTVRIEILPENGQVQILPFLRYNQCYVVRTYSGDCTWRQLLSNEEQMNGDYYYKAQWASGQTNEGKIAVKEPKTLKFRPR